MRLSRGKKESGFTLVEIAIVGAIIGLLAAIALPNFSKVRTAAQANSCLNNLRIIDQAKELYATESFVNNGVTPSDSSLSPYIRGGIQIAKNCPARGTVSTNAIGQNPTCTVSGHSLSSPTTMATTTPPPFAIVASAGMSSEVK